MPDGVSSDSRVMTPFPVYAHSASGAVKTTVGGHELIDYWAGHGALLLGHNAPTVTRAIAEQLARGTHFGACHELVVEWARLVTRLLPGADEVRFTGSGTEAVLLAIELARRYTAKPKVMRFAEHYHGWHSSIHCTSHGHSATRAYQVHRNEMIVCPVHDLDLVATCLRENDDIACIILEPTGPCSGVVPYEQTFLHELRSLSEARGVLLIFDEVVTGFRVSPGGAQQRFGVTPDLTTLAKVLCGGLPGGAVAGRREILAALRKQGSVPPEKPPVTHLGTFSGNPLSSAAGVAMLREVQTEGLHAALDQRADELRRTLNEIIDHHQLDWVVYGTSSCIKFLIGHGQSHVRTSDFDATTWDPAILLRRGMPEQAHALRLAMLIHGVDISLSSFITRAHTPQHIARTAEAFDASIELLRADGFIH